MRSKINDLEELSRNLDLTPTMLNYALERYQTIEAYLSHNGIDAFFYPQGSMRTGTVVRPIKNGQETDYDLDLVCQYKVMKSQTNPKLIKHEVGDTLKRSGIYSELLEPEDSRCWVLSYKGVNQEIGFKIDLVPAAKEDIAKINKLINDGIYSAFAQSAICVTNKINTDYNWISSNPKGFGEWFDIINERFLNVDLNQKKQKMYLDNRTVFSKYRHYEEIPNIFVRSSLQRTIQLLKRHRDIYFSRIKGDDKYKPSSIIITYLAAEIANNSLYTDLEHLLEYVVNEIRKYSYLLTRHNRINNDLTHRGLIKYINGTWYIVNPVDKEDNYAENWTKKDAELFFKWLEAFYNDVIAINPINEQRYLGGLKSSFGNDFVSKTLGVNNDVSSLQNVHQPWRVNDEE